MKHHPQPLSVKNHTENKQSDISEFDKSIAYGSDEIFPRLLSTILCTMFHRFELYRVKLILRW